MTDRILSCQTARELLALWAAEEEACGWHTAIMIAKRLAKVRAKLGQGTPYRKDTRLTSYLEFVRVALTQGNMSSTGRLGHPTKDLTDLQASLKAVALADTEAYETLERRIKSEYEDPNEEDESEVQAQG